MDNVYNYHDLLFTNDTHQLVVKRVKRLTPEEEVYYNYAKEHLGTVEEAVKATDGDSEFLNNLYRNTEDLLKRIDSVVGTATYTVVDDNTFNKQFFEEMFNNTEKLKEIAGKLGAYHEMNNSGS